MVNDVTQHDSIERLGSITVAEKLDIVLDWIARKTSYPGEAIRFNTELVSPAFFAKNREECVYLLNAVSDLDWIQRQWIGAKEPDPDVAVCIRTSGWKRIATDGGETSNIAFVAMWFDAQMQPAFKAIDKAIRACGYEAKRVDSEPHVSRIDQKIIADIRSSKFVVADVTGQRPGVYYEAGFANGINRPVIWTCRIDEMDKIHFDTRQFNHLFWSTPEDLTQQLEPFVLGLFGHGKHG